MDAPRRKLIPGAFIAADVAVLILALWLANRYSGLPFAWMNVEELLRLRPRVVDIVVAGCVLAFWPLLFSRFGLYRERYLSFLKFRTYHFLDLVKAITLGSLVLLGGIFAANLTQVTVDFIAVFWLANLVGTVLARELLIWTLRELRLQGRNLRYVLIVGTNERALEVARKIEEQPELGYRLRGFVDDEWRSHEHDPGMRGLWEAGFDELGNYLNRRVVDEVLIALPLATLYEEATRVVKICELHGIVVHFAPGLDFLNVGSSRMTFDSLDDKPIITLLPPLMTGWQVGVKRVIDGSGSLFLIVVFAPLMVAVAVAVKLTSPGPVMFVQERMGLFKRKIRVLKFRTMAENAESLQAQLEDQNEVAGPVFKITDDPRITRFGAFLRRSSLDELPQLFNVMWGDMSLVGPRPLPLRDYAGFDQDWHRRRFSVRPGITCLWQVSGRSAIPFERWMELDMEYINNWSLWLDLKILLKTLPAVLAERGAA